MKLKTLSLLFMAPSMVIAATTHHCRAIRIAVIDSGLDLSDKRFEGHICPNPGKSFVKDPKLTDAENLLDKNGHGTLVTSIIQQYAGDTKFCFSFYKYYSDTLPGIVNLHNEIKAIKQAIADGADIINISGGGPEFDEDESLAIKNNPDTLFVVAAGNDNQDLDKPENKFYPASYGFKNEIVVGALTADKKRLPQSNYGKNIVFKELGENVPGYLPDNKVGTMTGTSMATAIYTGKFVADVEKMCNSGEINASK